MAAPYKLSAKVRALRTARGSNSALSKAVEGLRTELGSLDNEIAARSKYLTGKPEAIAVRLSTELGKLKGRRAHIIRQLRSTKWRE